MSPAFHAPPREHQHSGSEPHEGDGRSVLLRLTARGRLLDQETAGTVEACVRRALASLPRASIDAAKQVLEAVARELARESRD